MGQPSKQGQGNWQDRPFRTVDGISHTLNEKGAFSLLRDGEKFSLSKGATQIGAPGEASVETLREIGWDAIVAEMQNRSVGELILVLESVGLDEVASEVVLRRMWHHLTNNAKTAPRPAPVQQTQGGGNNQGGGQSKPGGGQRRDNRPNPTPAKPPALEAKPEAAKAAPEGPPNGAGVPAATA